MTLGIKGKRAHKRTRRTNKKKLSRQVRLQRERFKKIMMITVMVGGLFGGGGFMWTHGVFTQIKDTVAAQALALSVDTGFQVDDVLVFGRKHVTQDVLLQHLNVERGTPILSVDLMAAAEKISNISWVKDVSVSRRLPNKIVVNMTERRPVALWQHEHKISVIDVNGVVLTTKNLAAYRDLPMVVGIDAGARIAGLLALLQSEPIVGAEVSSAVRVGQRRWNLHLKSGMVIKLPEKDVELALARLAHMEQKHKVLRKNVSYIDLRLPDQFIVARGMPNKKENI